MRVTDVDVDDRQTYHELEVDVDTHPGELLWSLRTMNGTCERP